MNIWFYDFLNSIFPRNCQVCGRLLSKAELVICLKCEYKMPRTLFTNNHDNPVSQLFWGRTHMLQATSLFKFEKGSAYQVLLHNLKYRGAKRNGDYLGKLLGLALKNTPYDTCDYIVPVPLHPSKLRKRGYNQALVIAEGVASIIHKPVKGDLLLRLKKTDSQTLKNRFERFLNMESKIILNPIFKHNEFLDSDKDLSFLLIDDVVTTGSTLEACSEAILDEIQANIYAATVAYA